MALVQLILVIVAIIMIVINFIKIYFRNAVYLRKGLFEWKFTLSKDAENNIKELKPSQFPTSWRYSAITDFITPKKPAISCNTISIDKFISTYLDKDTMLTPFCIGRDLNIILIQTPKQICLTNDKQTEMTFFYQTQAKFCQKNKINKIYSIPFMPFKETIMNRIEELLTEIEFEIVFIHNMGRCGSNYICNLLSNYDQDIQCVKETNILIQISHCYLNQVKKDKNYDDENMIELIKVNLILLIYSLLKNTNFKKNKIIFKESSEVMFISHLIHKALNKYNVKHIYMYRNIFDQIDSMYTALTMGIAKGRIIPNIYDFASKYKYTKYVFLEFMKYLCSIYRFDSDPKNASLQANIWGGVTDKDILSNINDTNLLPIILMAWINSMNMAYQQLKHKNFIAAIKYADLKQEPNRIIGKLFKKLKWIKDNEKMNIDKKIFHEDSHKMKGGVKSHRKGNKDFVILNSNDIRYINDHIDLSEFDKLETFLL